MTAPPIQPAPLNLLGAAHGEAQLGLAIHHEVGSDPEPLRIGSWELDYVEQILAFSMEAMSILQAKQSRFRFSSFLDAVPEIDRAVVQQALMTAFQQKTAVEFAHRIVVPGRGIRTLRHHVLRTPESDHRVVRLSGTMHDISEFKAIGQALRASEKTFRLLMTHAPHGIALLDAKGHFVDVNAALCSMLGYKREELIGENFLQITHPDDAEAGRRIVADMMRGDYPHFHYEKRYRHKDGSIIWSDVRTSAQYNDEGKLSLLVAHIQDITRRKHEEAEIRRLVFLDPLTGLPNRRMFMDHLELAWTQAQRHHRPFALIYVDLDNFKPINDRFGHATGDIFLMEVATRFSSSTRAGDTVARIGGDEFVILLSEVNDPIAPRIFADKLLEALNVPVQAGHQRLLPQASIGVATFPAESFANPEAMLRAADRAMYRAKQSGGGCYRLAADSADYPPA